MSQSRADVHTLVARVKRGDEKALGTLLQRYEGEARRAARGLLSPAMRPLLDPGDLIQSVFQTLLLRYRRKKLQISCATKLGALIQILLRHHVIREWRRLQCQQRVAQRLARQAGPRGREPTNPSRTAEYRELFAQLCGELEEKDRRIVEMCSLGYSTAEIAAILKLNADVLRVRLSRLRRRWRERWLLREAL
jgi:RNA polymerase sigma factor (sigma-70 family)